jgi:WD40 repeat protein
MNREKSKTIVATGELSFENGRLPEASRGDAPETTGGAMPDTTLPKLYTRKEGPFYGSMGQVFRVHHNGWHVDLAMKCSLLKGEKQKKEFVEECDTWINLGLHPHIVSCYYSRDMDGTLAIFSEWMDGGNLKDHIGKGDGPLYRNDPARVTERILDIAIQVARGLDYAHKQRPPVIHRDVKPANILLASDGSVKIADFGISKTEKKLYTPAYCSPEQVEQVEQPGRFAPLTPKTDVWSWAATLLEMFVGPKPPQWMDGAKLAGQWRAYARSPRVPIPRDMETLLADCFATNEAFRPDFEQIETRLLILYEKETGRPYPRPRPKAASDSADSFNNKALSYLDMGMTQKACECWKEALAKNPEHLESVYNYTLHLCRSDHIDEHEAIIRMERMGYNATEWSAKYLVAQFYIEHNCIDKARARLHEATTLPNGRNKDIEALLADIDVLEKNYIDIEDYYSTIALITLSDDGKLMLLAHNDTISLYDVETKKHIRDYSNIYPEATHNIAFFPDNNSYFLSSDVYGEIYLWDTEVPDKIIRSFKGPTQGYLFFSVDPDQKKLLAGNAYELRIWNIETGDCLFVMDCSYEPVDNAAFFDSNTFFTKNQYDKIERKWRLKVKRKWPLKTKREWYIKTKREWYKNTECEWYIKTEINAATYKNLICDQSVFREDFDRERKTVISIGHKDKENVTCNLAELFLEIRAKAPEGIKDIILLPQYKLILYGGKYGLIYAHDMDTFKKYGYIAEAGDLHKLCRNMTDYRLRYISMMGAVRWRMPAIIHYKAEWTLSKIKSTYSKLEEEKRYADTLNEAEKFIAQGKLAEALSALDSARQIDGFEHDAQWEALYKYIRRFCSVKTLRGAKVKEIPFKLQIYKIAFTNILSPYRSRGMNRIYFAAASPDGKYLVILAGKNRGMTFSDRRIFRQVPEKYEFLSVAQVFDLSSGKCIQSFHTDYAFCTAKFNHAGDAVLLSGSLLQLMDITTGKIKEYGLDPTCEDFSPDDRMIAAASFNLHDKSVLNVWNVSKRKRLVKRKQSDFIDSLHFSPDGKSILISNTYLYPALYLVDASTGKLIRKYNIMEAKINYACFSPDGRQILAYKKGDGKIFLLDEADESPVRQLENYPETLCFACFSPDGKNIIALTEDNTIIVWNCKSGACINTLTGYVPIDFKGTSVVNGRYIISYNEDRVLIQELDYEYEFPGWKDWDEGARPYLEIFLTLHPRWTERDFEWLVNDLQEKGYGWLRPEGIKEQLLKMTSKRTKLFRYLSDKMNKLI